MCWPPWWRRRPKRALELIEQAADHLAQMAHSVARQLTFREPYTLVFSGGVLRDCAVLVRRLKAVLDLPQARIAPLTIAPARGAVSLLWTSCNYSQPDRGLASGVLRPLRGTSPPSRRFASLVR